jgi:hypothetical protein
MLVFSWDLSAAFMAEKQLNGSQLTGYFAKRLFEIVEQGMDNKTLMMWRPGIGDLVDPADTPAGTIYDVRLCCVVGCIVCIGSFVLLLQHLQDRIVWISRRALSTIALISSSIL